MESTDGPGRWARDPIVRHYGGLLTERTASDEQQGHCHRLQAVFDRNVALLEGTLAESAGGVPTLLVTRSSEANALAYRTGAHRAVIVHIGFLERLWSVVARAAHAPTVLAAAEPFMASETALGGAFSGEPEDWSLPRERIEYFLHVHLFMLEYIVLHEIAHHARGHLELVPSGSPRAVYDERLARRRAAGTDLAGTGFAVRDLEFDADVYAVELALLALDAVFPFESDRWDEGEALEHVFLYLFAHLLVAQQLAEQTPPSVTPSAPRRHPAAVYRAINYANLLTRAFHRLGGGAWDAYRLAHDQAWTEASFVAKLEGDADGIWHGEDFAEGLLERFVVDEQLGFEAVARLDVRQGKSRE